MDVELVPVPDDPVVAAVRTALAEAELETGSPPRAYRSRWRVAALAEGVDRSPTSDLYPFSPRRTRGATRA